MSLPGSGIPRPPRRLPPSPPPLPFAEIGPVPCRDRSGSGSRSVRFRLEIGPVPCRDRSDGGEPDNDGNPPGGPCPRTGSAPPKDLSASAREPAPETSSELTAGPPRPGRGDPVAGGAALGGVNSWLQHGRPRPESRGRPRRARVARRGRSGRRRRSTSHGSARPRAPLPGPDAVADQRQGRSCSAATDRSTRSSGSHPRSTPGPPAPPNVALVARSRHSSEYFLESHGNDRPPRITAPIESPSKPESQQGGVIRPFVCGCGRGGRVPAVRRLGTRGRTRERLVVRGDARSYPGARGRTRGRAVVPRGARSYPGARGRTLEGL